MERETREPLPGAMISISGTESTGFSRVGELALRMVRALMDRDRRKENDLEDHH